MQQKAILKFKSHNATADRPNTAINVDIVESEISQIGKANSSICLVNIIY